MMQACNFISSSFRAPLVLNHLCCYPKDSGQGWYIYRLILILTPYGVGLTLPVMISSGEY